MGTGRRPLLIPSGGDVNREKANKRPIQRLCDPPRLALWARHLLLLVLVTMIPRASLQRGDGKFLLTIWKPSLVNDE